MRNNPDSYYDSLTEKEARERLLELGELSGNPSTEAMKNKLKSLERTRHLIAWLDNSTVANHGHLVCLITCLYDPAVFYTDEEFAVKTGKWVNIQSEIETPELHIIARCGSSDNELLAYAETRLKCVQELKIPVSCDGIEYQDVLRLCHGDNPARAHETGQQKGGHYFCSTCGVHCDRTSELDHVLNCKLRTLHSKQQTILKGAIARRNSMLYKAKPLHSLSRPDLERELASREVFDSGSVKHLQGMLDKQMCGQQRVPALLFNCPKTSLKDLGLDRYEVLLMEPLHDIGHHIENVFTEFPKHLTLAETKLVEETIQTCIGNKDSKRTADYRKALVQTTALLQKSGAMTNKALTVFETLIEMQRILYPPDNKRSPALVPSLLQPSMVDHSILLREFVERPRKLTLRKMFGVYFHNLSAHGGLMLRIISGLSANAEKQEQIFNAIKRITNRTINYHPGHIIPNVFIRLQAEKELDIEQNDVARQQAVISNLAKCLKAPSNIRIPLAMVRKYSREWQAHLQQVSDFLAEGDGVWWSKDGDTIEFHDITNHPTTQEAGPALHHFRSSILVEEVAYLNQHWHRCIEDQITIPTHIIRMDQENGTTKVTRTTFLGDQPPTTSTASIECPRNVTHLDTSAEANPGQDVSEDQDSEDNEIENVIDVVPAEDEIVDLGETVNIATQSEDVTVNQVSQSKAAQSMSTGTEQESPSTPEQHLPPALQNQYLLQTRLGKAVAVVLGQTAEVESLDKNHHDLKTLKKSSQPQPAVYRWAEEKYKNTLAPIQVKVLAARTKSEKELAAWEKEYFLNNNFVSPSHETMKADSVASVLVKQVKYAQALLKEWNISF